MNIHHLSIISIRAHPSLTFSRRPSYLCDLSDLLCDILGSVFNLAGCNDFNLSGRRRYHPVRAKGESNLRYAADCPVSHQVRV